MASGTNNYTAVKAQAGDTGYFCFEQVDSGNNVIKSYCGYSKRNLDRNNKLQIKTVSGSTVKVIYTPSDDQSAPATMATIFNIGDPEDFRRITLTFEKSHNPCEDAEGLSYASSLNVSLFNRNRVQHLAKEGGAFYRGYLKTIDAWTSLCPHMDQNMSHIECSTTFDLSLSVQRPSLPRQDLPFLHEAGDDNIQNRNSSVRPLNHYVVVP